jgi:hypothetical protein
LAAAAAVAAVAAPIDEIVIIDGGKVNCLDTENRHCKRVVIMKSNTA